MSGIASGRPGVTVTQFVHPNFPQRSVIARIAGQNDSLPAVILGAHQDSINSANPANVSYMKFGIGSWGPRVPDALGTSRAHTVRRAARPVRTMTGPGR